MKNAIKALIRPIVPVKLRPRLVAHYKAIHYFGFKFDCPYCRSNLRSFIPFGLSHPVLAQMHVVGGGYRLNGRCPVCGSNDRERLLYLYLVHKTDLLERHSRLLHVAPEPRLERFLRDRGNLDYLTADLDGEGVMVKMDICNIQYPDNSFDAIICNHVLEHIVDDRRAISELYRTLKPGGWAILQVPMSMSLETTYEDFSITTPSAREKAFGQEDHVRIYAKDYTDRLHEAGFHVVAFEWWKDGGSFGGPKNTFGLNEEESVYTAIKRP